VRWVAVRSRKTVWNMRGVWVGIEGLIGDIPWGVGYRSGYFGLVSLDGLKSTSSKFYSIRPHWF